ncbi:hypothetical protein TCSYLVIO_007021 [Trypanosoma cruzi]|nr:hypothetical protein TCSYLVIO_007021 [Trypanosoma cruzi]
MQKDGGIRNMESHADTGKIRLLVRRDGVSGPMQTYEISDLAEAMSAVQLLPFVPKSHKELILPSMAELYDEETDNMDIVDKNLQPADFAWLELECDDDATIEKVISYFPIHSSTKEDVKSGRNDNDVAEIFPLCGYVCIHVAARHATQALLGDEGEEPVRVCMIAFERFLLTIFRSPVAGGDEVRAQMEFILSSLNPHTEPVSILVCSLITAFVKEYQKEPSSLLVEVDNVNELVLQIQPSQCDQMDLLRRIEDLRHRLTRVQTTFLAKERLIQQLLLPVMRRIFITADSGALSRYQRLLSGLLLSIEHLRKGRDVLNLSSMSLVSGVSMRLLQHCYWMDFVSTVLTEVMMVAMPVSIIPGLFTMNVKVPFQESKGLMTFSMIALVTALVFFVGMIKPLFLYIRHKPPGALVPPSLS